MVQIGKRITRDPHRTAILALAAAFFAVTSWTSYARWAGFGYRTFDLAYYVQAIWQLIHGRFVVSVQYVPLLGNHVEPIVFLVAPFFFLVRHPMVFVLLQNAALATMGPVGYGIAKRLGFSSVEALLLGAAVLITPASGYIALHEFHPEALTAPFLLLMLRARLVGSPGKHWLWFLAVLACKENMALLLASYCAIQCLSERKQGWGYLRRWYVAPMVVALLWFVIATKVITPALNAGNIDYLALYERLGSSPGEIVLNVFRQPQRIARVFSDALLHGNLVWALFLPLLCLPLLRPKWVLICAPIFLQHLLSWRSSEWMIYFHYAAPIVPLLWFAAAEGLLLVARWKRATAWLVVIACLVAQVVWGPAGEIAATIKEWSGGAAERARKQNFLAAIPAQASVTAPLPYLSHLAMRQELHSLHYILKGLKTLSRQTFTPPPPTEFVLLDYKDAATFDSSAGYYHPQMRTTANEIIPSSDKLLHEYLSSASWEAHSSDELTLLHRASAHEAEPSTNQPMLQIGAHTALLALEKSNERIRQGESFEIRSSWNFQLPRGVFPWLEVHLNSTSGRHFILVKGLCAPEAVAGNYEERWEVTATSGIPAGQYQIEAFFFDNAKRAWLEANGKPDPTATLLAPSVSLGTLEVMQ